MKQRFTFKGKGIKNLYSVSPETAARTKFLRRPRDLMPRPAEGGKKWQR
jgi:hypothetical protein